MGGLRVKAKPCDRARSASTGLFLFSSASSSTQTGARTLPRAWARTGCWVSCSFSLSLSLPLSSPPNCSFLHFTPVTSIFPPETSATCQSLGHVQENPHPCNASALGDTVFCLLVSRNKRCDNDQGPCLCTCCCRAITSREVQVVNRQSLTPVLNLPSL